MTFTFLMGYKSSRDGLKCTGRRCGSVCKCCTNACKRLDHSQPLLLERDPGASVPKPRRPRVSYDRLWSPELLGGCDLPILSLRLKLDPFISFDQVRPSL